MCRNIKKLRYPDRPPTDDELRLAAVQFVRKVTGYHTPSRRHTAAFEHAVTAISATLQTLFQDLPSPPKDPSAVMRDA